MSDKPKPPLTVWLEARAAECMHDDGLCYAFPDKQDSDDQGPYVHLDQFIQMVGERAKEKCKQFFGHQEAEYRLKCEAFQEIIKEIKG